MLVSGFDVRSRWATFLMAATVACASLTGGAAAQDKLQLDKDSGTATAEATEPVLVVSVASLNKLMQDVNYVTAAVGQPATGGFFAMMAGGFAQGLDMSKPIGVIVPIVDGAPEPIGMIPTPDAESMLKKLESQGQIGAIDKLDDGTLVIPAGPSLVYIRQAGPWAIVARQKELLDLAPADPMEVMEDLGNNYTFAARLNVQEIPEETREGLIAQLRQGFTNAMAQQGGDTENLQAASEDSIKQIEQLIRESQELMIGWNINPEEKIITFDTEFIASEGSEMAEMYSGQKVIASKFASVINDENAMYYHAAASLGPKVVERTLESIESAKVMLAKAINDAKDMEADEKTHLNELTTSLIALVSKSIKEGKFDLGVQSTADDGHVQLTAGMFVSDGAQALKLVKDLAGKLKTVKDAPTFAFDQDTYKGVALHSMKIEIPAKQAELREIFGEETEVKIGTSPKAVYFSLGTDSETSLKEFIKNGTESDDPTDRPLGQLQIRLLPYLRFAQSVKANDVVASMIDTLSQNNETDYVLLDAEMIENGQSSYIEIGEGILKAIGAAVREAQMQQMKQMQKGGGKF
jgi:hypothetical protein